MGEMRLHDELSRAGVMWCLRLGCVVAMTEVDLGMHGIADAFGCGIIRGKQRGVLVEAKTSRSDFKRDKHKPHRFYDQDGGKYGISDRYYLVSDGLVTPDEVQEPWGLLVIDEGESYPRIAKRCQQFSPDPAWWAHHFATTAKYLAAQWAREHLYGEEMPDIHIGGMPDELAHSLAPLRHMKLYRPSANENWVTP
jgi:hypothetical protein